MNTYAWGGMLAVTMGSGVGRHTSAVNGRGGTGLDESLTLDLCILVRNVSQ